MAALSRRPFFACRRQCAQGDLRGDRLPGAARQVLDELPRRASRAGPARRRPFERIGAYEVPVTPQAEMIHVAEHHLEILVLAALVKAEPQAETVRERDFLLHGLAR